MDRLAEMLISFLPLAFLSVVIAIGYYLAWTDFKPKRIDANASYGIALEPVSDTSPKKRAYTDQELGLHKMNSLASLSDAEQRRLKMAERIRQFSQRSPGEAAGVIKGWMSDR